MNEIETYDEKIEDLAREKIDAERKLSERKAECVEYESNTVPLDPNKYDFLLDF